MQKRKKIPVDLKYKLYEESVQHPPADIDFINKEYKKLRKQIPLSLREDFGGTALLSCLWAQQSLKHKSWSVDLTKEPQNYGMANHCNKMSAHAKKRVFYIQGNVLDKKSFKVDVVTAFNFSYFILKKRKDFLNYGRRVLEGLNTKGLFVLDIFGGSECFQEIEEETDFKHHSYFWDLSSYNPITHEALYYIHFKDKKQKILYREVFKYDWRHWGIKEVEEILLEAGFSKVLVYWEEEGEDGEGNGEFYTSVKEENCASWVAYIVALK